MSKHTPGRWYVGTVKLRNTTYYKIFEYRCGYEIASTCGDEVGQGTYNAFLMAAAPELLEAAKLAMEEFLGDPESKVARTLARAIAMAEGEYND